MSQAQDNFQTPSGETGSHPKPPLALPDLSDPKPDPIRIYVACLASYNNGILHGRWIDVSDEATIWAEVQAMLKASPLDEVCEEWAIHDYEGFEGANIGEYYSFGRVVELAEFIREHSELGAEVLNYYGGELKDALEAFENYSGEYENLADFAHELTEQSGVEVPKSVKDYIDYEAMAGDMSLSGDILTFETGPTAVHVFWSH